MLLVALILVIVSVIVFALDFLGWAGRALIALGLAIFASGIACYLLDILHGQGKL